MKTSLIMAVFVAALAADARSEDTTKATLTQQPLNQQNVIREILALGGDWEAPSKTLLVGFIGKKFTEEQFSLLAPLVDLRILYFQDVRITEAALRNCVQLTQLAQLQVVGCDFNGSGLKHFSKCTKLKRVFIEETPLNDSGLEQLATLPNMETLEISICERTSLVTAEGIRHLKHARR
jgi:hypothetical protein